MLNSPCVGGGRYEPFDRQRIIAYCSAEENIDKDSICSRLVKSDIDPIEKCVIAGSCRGVIRRDELNTGSHGATLVGDLCYYGFAVRPGKSEQVCIARIVD